MGLLSTAHATSTPSAEGYWKTIDDVTGKPKSIVRISRAADNTLMGEVVRLYPAKGEDPNRLCTACTGNLHNRPVVGMVILSGLKPQDVSWGEGRILDPHNGKTYKCMARLTAHGEKLKVRGYIGLPAFGRSQTWQRVDLMSAQG